MRKKKKATGFWTRKKVLWAAAGTLLVLVLLYVGVFHHQQDSAKAKSVTASLVTKGSLASSTLLTGTVKAQSEQYVYFDSSVGRSATVLVNVGDQVTVGQQLVQYDSTAAQAAYDTAARAYNKAVRDRDYFRKNGVAPSATTPTTDTDSNSDGDGSTTTTQPQQSTADYNLQLQDYNDAVDNAASELQKAQDTLNQTIILSDVNGTVVEVTDSVDPASKDSQTLVHVTSEGQYQIEGTLTEYDLPNLSVGQNVTITSKVYPDQKWTGKVSYISNYPNQSSQTTKDSSSGQSSGSKYDYKVDLTSPIGDLKQGFSVSLEVTKGEESLLVPVTSVVTEKDQHYVWTYDEKTQKIQKTKVELGNADATNQEITSGLSENQKVITTAESSYKNGETLDDVTVQKAKTSKKEVTSSE